MKDLPLSTCESEFVKQGIEKKLRLDGRGIYERRKVQLTFGDDSGCCLVRLGATIVFCQVSAEIEEPKLMRPNEGNLYINLDLSPSASPAFVDKRNMELAVSINRILEKTIKEAKAVDLEGLCIISGEKVWSIRVDLQALNHEGNLLDCACVAAIAALAHFRRPDITVDDGKITVHPVDEKEPVPLSVLHYPFTVSISFFQQGQYLLVDASLLEERVSDGAVVAAMNRHGELCCLQLNGQLIVTQHQIERCIDIAGNIVDGLTKTVQEAIERDELKRRSAAPLGFPAAMQAAAEGALPVDYLCPASPIFSDEEPAPDACAPTSSAASAPTSSAASAPTSSAASAPTSSAASAATSDMKVQVVSPGVIGLGGPSAWQPVTVHSSSDDDDADTPKPASRPKAGRSPIKAKAGRSPIKAKLSENAVVLLDSDSEEEVVTLSEQQFTDNVNATK